MVKVIQVVHYFTSGSSCDIKISTSRWIYYVLVAAEFVKLIGNIVFTGMDQIVVCSLFVLGLLFASSQGRKRVNVFF